MGIVLTGSEVKSLREGRANIAEAYAREEGGQIVLVNSTIPIYPPAGQFNHEPGRKRVLLVKKREYNRLMGAVQREGRTLVPLELYFGASGMAKVKLALATGRKAVSLYAQAVTYLAASPSAYEHAAARVEYGTASRSVSELNRGLTLAESCGADGLVRQAREELARLG